MRSTLKSILKTLRFGKLLDANTIFQQVNTRFLLLFKSANHVLPTPTLMLKTDEFLKLFSSLLIHTWFS